MSLRIRFGVCPDLECVVFSNLDPRFVVLKGENLKKRDPCDRGYIFFANFLRFLLERGELFALVSKTEPVDFLWTCQLFEQFFCFFAREFICLRMTAPP